jgi:ketosteroid isomerase-like protein
MNSIANSLLAAVALLCGCATHGTIRHPVDPSAVLVKTDRDFAAFAQQHGVANGFREFAAPDAMSLPMGEAPIHGRDAIFRAMSDSPPGQLSWEPSGGEIARSGDLGYTWGTYEFRTSDTEGKPVTRHGKYVTVWKKQRDGSWKYVVDIGNSNPPPK